MLSVLYLPILDVLFSGAQKRTVQAFGDSNSFGIHSVPNTIDLCCVPVFEISHSHVTPFSGPCDATHLLTVARGSVTLVHPR